MPKAKSSASDRQAELRKNYLQAIENRESDLADTKSDEEAFVVLANVSAARDALLRSVRAGLSSNADQIEKAFKALQAANQNVEEGRRRAEKLVVLLNKLTSATSSAADLAKALERAKKDK